jgi:hypothetical protein
MATFDQVPQNTTIKLLLMGVPGTAKTGGLCSLVQAGYKLRIIDFDNLLGSLAQQIAFHCPDKIKNVSVMTFTDKFKGGPQGPITDGIPSAYSRAMAILNHWKDSNEDLGSTEKWSPKDTIVVLDSLTSTSAAAFRFYRMLNPTAKDPRQIYGLAQDSIINLLDLLCSETYLPNVIVIAHVKYDKDHLEITRGFPRSVGSALDTQIGGKFNSILLAETQGIGPGAKRVLRTNSTGLVELKNPVPFKLTSDELPIQTGLADFFKAVKGSNPL